MEIQEAAAQILNKRIDLELKIVKDRKEFDSIIIQLILSTPSGELRNKLTDLNILHLLICDSFETLNR